MTRRTRAQGILSPEAYKLFLRDGCGREAQCGQFSWARRDQFPGSNAISATGPRHHQARQLATL